MLNSPGLLRLVECVGDSTVPADLQANSAAHESSASAYCAPAAAAEHALIASRIRSAPPFRDEDYAVDASNDLSSSVLVRALR